MRAEISSPVIEIGEVESAYSFNGSSDRVTPSLPSMDI